MLILQIIFAIILNLKGLQILICWVFLRQSCPFLIYLIWFVPPLETLSRHVNYEMHQNLLILHTISIDKFPGNKKNAVELFRKDCLLAMPAAKKTVQMQKLEILNLWSCCKFQSGAWTALSKSGSCPAGFWGCLSGSWEMCNLQT